MSRLRLVTAEPTTWHSEQQGFFTLPAGTEAMKVDDIENEVDGAEERQALTRLVKRELDAGHEPVLVWLGGFVRCVYRHQLAVSLQMHWGRP